ncbi:thioredoxin family protein [Pedobacter frigiditerrae]|uniref:thioredoxin family protein n=1 Tax=Pedobacter frigiditerrae TaxID=2530452 RepID=UPI0029319F2C|nr:thioredoxin family protein [Pedobacter frigiditerrae]
MKNLLIITAIALSLLTTKWEPNFETAKKTAKEKNELILLNFSGSDWCGPCIRMHKEIFDDAAFSKMAEQNLVMVNADFPRNKKNQLPANIKKQNEALADQYNPTGKFPYTVLLNAEGKVIKAWEGLPDETPNQFTAAIKQICDATKQR